VFDNFDYTGMFDALLRSMNEPGACETVGKAALTDADHTRRDMEREFVNTPPECRGTSFEV
jgi:hypothetical protein